MAGLAHKSPSGIIVLSHPGKLPGEAPLVQSLLEAGLSRFHLRKPGASVMAYRQLIMALPPALRTRVVIHEHHLLAQEFGLGGVHFREPDRKRLPGWEWEQVVEREQQYGRSVSTAVHGLDTWKTQPGVLNYGMLSPIMGSISKPGITPANPWYLEAVQQHTRERKGPVPVALGGVHAGNLHTVRGMGFQAVAVLGCIWENPQEALAQYNTLNHLWEQLATPDLTR